MSEAPTVETANMEEDHFDAEAETVTDAWEGAYIYASWGYRSTTVDFAQIVEVSDTGKTVKCRLVTNERVNTTRGSESVRPSSNQYGDEFRLHVRGSGGSVSFRGSYPYIDGDMDEGTRLESFLPVSNDAGKTYHQSPPNQR